MKRLVVKHKLADASSEPRECFSANVELPEGYFFGMSAATGGLSDNHDVIQFTVSEVNSLPKDNDDIIKEKNNLRNRFINRQKNRLNNRAKKPIFENADLSDPVKKYRNDKYKKIEEFENKIDDILINDDHFRKTKNGVINSVQDAINARSKEMLDDPNYKEDAAKVIEYKNKLVKLSSTVKSLTESMNKLSKSFAATQEETLGEIKSKSNIALIVFVVVVQIIVVYVLFTWKKTQKKTTDSYLEFY